MKQYMLDVIVFVVSFALGYFWHRIKWPSFGRSYHPSTPAIPIDLDFLKTASKNYRDPMISSLTVRLKGQENKDS